MPHSPGPAILWLRLWLTLGPCGHLRASAGLAETLGWGEIRTHQEASGTDTSGGSPST